MEEFIFEVEGQKRLEAYFDGIGLVLGSAERKASFAVYSMGLFGDGARKSMEPISSRASASVRRVDAQYQRVQNFVTDSAWSDRRVRKEAAKYGISSMIKREPVSHWIIDDTGFLKQGRHSVGVKRQYTGSAGKVANCQIGVSLTIATATQHLPIDFALYLPHEWADDPQRREEGRIPDDVQFATKLELALEMIEEALQNGTPPGRVLVDTAYGNSSRFRRRLRGLELQYAVAIQCTTKVWQLDSLERRRGGKTLSVAELAKSIGV